jgi:DNA-binding response OmpR family regulator
MYAIEDREKSFEHGADAHVPKPISKMQLFKTIEWVLKNSTRRHSVANALGLRGYDFRRTDYKKHLADENITLQKNSEIHIYSDAERKTANSAHIQRKCFKSLFKLDKNRFKKNIYITKIKILHWGRFPHVFSPPFPTQLPAPNFFDFY